MDRFDETFTKICDRLALYVCGGIALIMMLYVFVHVFSRYVLRIGGVEGTYTFVGALLVPLIYLGLAYSWYKRGYVVVDIIQVKLGKKAQWGFQFAFLLITLVIFVLMIFYGTILDTIESYVLHSVIGEAGHRLPVWPWKTTIIIGTFLMAVRNILDMTRMIKTGELISTNR